MVLFLLTGLIQRRKNKSVMNEMKIRPKILGDLITFPLAPKL